MLTALALLLQTSALVAPLHHGDAPPPARAIAALRVLDEPGRPGSAQVTARQVLAGLRSPRDFVEVAQTAASRRQVARTGVIGIHPPGLIAPPLEAALAGLAVGEFAPPIESDGGLWIVQRIEAAVGCRQLFVSGLDDAAKSRAEHFATLARGGADFAALAREHSAERASALRGGDFAIFERGAKDAGLRAATFAASVGEIVGPIATPLGYHVLQRVGVEALDPRLRDDSWARVRAIWITHDGAIGADPSVERSFTAAEALAAKLATQLRRGADMAQLAREHTDDVGLREFGGDCGWVRRGVTRMPEVFDRVFVTPPGVQIGPLATNAGFLLIRREDRGVRSRLDLRVEPLVDLEQWVRAVAGEPDAQSPNALAAGVAAAREIDAALGSPLAWALIERLLPGCADAADFAARVEALPERFAAPGGRELELRALARRWAGVLAELEPHHAEHVWPEHQRAVEARIGPLRPQLAALAPVSLDMCVDVLGLADPRINVPVYLVARAPKLDGAEHCSLDGALRRVSVERRAGMELVDSVMLQVCGALELTDRSARGRVARLRQAILASDLGAREQLAQDAAHVALSATVGWLVRWVFDIERRDGEDFDAAHQRLGAAARAIALAWSEQMAGKLALDEVLDRALAALRESRR